MTTGSALTPEQKTTFLFVFLGVIGWFISGRADVGQTVQFAVLLGVGVVVPTLLNEWRRRNDGE